MNVDPMHPDGKCRCAGEGRCDWCLRQRQNAIAADLAIVASFAMRTNDAEVVDALRRIDHAADALIVDLASVLAVVHVVGKSLAAAEAERDRSNARVKLVESRIDTAIGILRGTALAAVEVFADAGCTADEIDEAIAFLDPNGNAGDVEPGDVTNHGYRVPIALAKIAAALRRRGQ